MYDVFLFFFFVVVCFVLSSTFEINAMLIQFNQN